MLIGRFLTVRRGLTFIILLLAGLIQALMLVVLISSVDKRNSGRELVRTSEIVGLLSDAALSWSRERSHLAIALAVATPAEPQVLRALADARRRGADALAQAREALARSPELRPKALLLSEVEESLTRLEPLRAASDTALSKAGAERGAQLLDSGPDALTQVIDRTQDLSQRLLAIGEELEPAASLVRLQVALWTVEELAWREQAILGAARAAGRDLSATALERLGQARGRQGEAWKTAQAIAARLPGNSLSAKMESARTSYFNRAGAGVDPDNAPWSPATSRSLDSLRAAHSAAGAATARAAAELTEVSEGAITLGYILLGGAMMGSALALAIIHFGLYRPLTRLAEAAGRMAQIEERDGTTVEIPSHRRQDELGALARTLGALQARRG